MTEYTGPTRRGRPRASTRASISGVALRLFRERGFVQTSVEDIASAAGIGRSTFFNYFGSKSEVIWGCQAHQLELLRALLDESAGDPFSSAESALVEMTAEIGPDEARTMSDYRALLDTTPELRLEAQAWSAERASVLASFIAARLGQQERDLVPLSYAYAMNGAIAAASVAFARSRDRRLSELMAESLRPVSAGFHRLG